MSLLRIEWMNHLIGRYREQPGYDNGELSERQIENLRPRGNVTTNFGRTLRPTNGGRAADTADRPTPTGR